MTPIEIQLLVTMLCLVYLIVEVGLVYLNMKHVKCAEAPPPILTDHFDEDTWKRSREYTLVKGQFELIKNVFNGFLLLLLANSDVLGWLERHTPLAAASISHGVLYVLIVMLLLTLIGIPFQVYKTFSIESRFGFNTTTMRTWALDLLKSFFLSWVLMIPLLAGLLWFVQSTGDFWWLYAWVFIALFQLSLLFLYPVLFAPLFNKFAPLETGELKDQLDALARKLSFQTAGIFVMDGSTRSKHGNAYFTGFGKNKRIVLFDTLVDTLPNDELAAVLAHEIGHEKLNHIKKSVFLSMIFLGVGLWLLAQLMHAESLYFAFGFENGSAHAALVLFLLFSEPILFFVSPLTSLLSRVFEYQADRFAVDAVQGAEPLQRALLNLSKKSLANLTPHPWYSFFYYSHPTLIERYVAMEDYAVKRN